MAELLALAATDVGEARCRGGLTMWTRNEAILLGLQQMCREIGCDTAASISDGTVTHGRDAKEMSRRRSWARKGWLVL